MLDTPKSNKVKTISAIIVGLVLLSGLLMASLATGANRNHEVSSAQEFTQKIQDIIPICNSAHSIPIVTVKTSDRGIHTEVSCSWELRGDTK